MPGTLYIVATPIGNLEDITGRAIRTLREVDLIACEDTRHTKKLAARFDIRTPLTSFFKGNESAKASTIIARLKEGRNVALVSDAGTPCISDPGFPLLARAVEEGIAIVPIPGPCALAAALSASGLPTDRFTFVGFLPDKPGKRRRALEGLRPLGHTLALYVSPWKAAATVADCLEVFGDRRACLCRELTKVHEEFVRGSLSEIAGRIEGKPPKGEMTLIIDMKAEA
ncbi:MAG: 16S rRNA (cytidine(1402)-2'-O)-methyltransferase [Proteobacteria bacterium]|nr:16S rRNA (cytidine(1402)-2'-O)-methyltransferase [Pseudomonadota bacterium]